MHALVCYGQRADTAAPHSTLILDVKSHDGRERAGAAEKMDVSNANKALIRCSYSNDRFTVNLNSFGKAPDALHQAPPVPVTSRYLMARMGVVAEVSV